LTCTFLDCVVLCALSRRVDREAWAERLRAGFGVYGHGKCSVSINEFSRLVQEQGCLPRSQREQQEFGRILDDVDEGGTGFVNFQEFEYIMQRIREHKEITMRLEEEEYADSLGMPREQCRELRRAFFENVPDGSRVLGVSELHAMLQHCMTREHSAKVLQNLFELYHDDSVGGIDMKNFLRFHRDINTQLPPQVTRTQTLSPSVEGL